MSAEKQIDRGIRKWAMKLANRKDTAGVVTVVVTVGVLAMLVFLAIVFMLGVAVGSANAHPGGLAKDGCHKMKAVGERHWHIEGTRERAGECVKVNGQTLKMTDWPMSLECQGKLSWLVDGNNQYGKRVRVKVADLDEVARVCLGREPKD